MKIVDWDARLGKVFRPYIGTHSLDDWGRDLFIHILGLTLYIAWTK